MLTAAAVSIPTREQSALALEEGKNLFLHPSCPYDRVLACWRRAKEHFSTELTTFLEAQKSLLLQEFLGDNYESSMKEAKQEPWSTKDMNVYYENRKDNKHIYHALHNRRLSVIANNSHTDFDIYQRIRDDNQAERKALREQYNPVLKRIELIHLALGNEQNDLYFNSLLSLAYTLRHQFLAMATKTKVDPKKNASPEAKIETGSLANTEIKSENTNETFIQNTLTKVDALCENIALMFNGIIYKRTVTSQKDQLQSFINKLDGLQQEIIPWLSLYFRERLLFTDNSAEENQLIDEFLQFHSLRGHSLLDMTTMLIGTPMKTALVNSLKSERNTWLQLQSQPLADRLTAIRRYLTSYRLSDYVCNNILRNLFQESEQHGHDPEFSSVFYYLIERIKKEKLGLPIITQYLHLLKKDVEQNTLFQNKTLAQCPILPLTLLCDDPQTLIEKSLNISAFPPSAKLFYTAHPVDADAAYNPQHKQQLLALLSSWDTASRKKFFQEIFSDHTHMNFHSKLMCSDFVDILGLQVTDYPIIALRLHYTKQRPATDVLTLWNKALDEGLFQHTQFFNYQENCELFENISALRSQLLEANLITQNQSRYKELYTVLNIYVSTHAFVSTLGLFSDIFISDKANWAENFSSAILQVIAFPNHCATMNFTNVIQFLGIDFGKTLPALADKKQQISQAQQASHDYFLTRPDINPSYFNKLINGFGRLYSKESLRAYTAIKIRIPFFQMTTLPGVCANIAEYGSDRTVVAIPPFISDIKSSELLGMMVGELIQGEMMDSLKGMRDNLNGKKDKAKNNKRMQPLVFTFKLYHAYCELQFNRRNEKDVNLQRDYSNIILFNSAPSELFTSLNSITDEINLYFEEQSNSDKVDLTKIKNQQTNFVAILRSLEAAFCNLMDDKTFNKTQDLLEQAIHNYTFTNSPGAPLTEHISKTLRSWLPTSISNKLSPKDQYPIFLKTLLENINSIQAWQKQQIPSYLTHWNSSNSIESSTVISQHFGFPRQLDTRSNITEEEKKQQPMTNSSSPAVSQTDYVMEFDEQQDEKHNLCHASQP